MNSWFRSRPAESTPEPKQEARELLISASDDLLKRAENIVWLLGYRGSVGDFVLTTYRLLKAYEDADRLRADAVSSSALRSDTDEAQV